MREYRLRNGCMKVLGQRENFLGIEADYSSYRNSSAVIVSAPYEHTTSYGKGAKDGPKEILRASHYVEFYDEELAREVFRRIGIATLAPLSFAKRVDSAAVDLVYQTVKKLLADEKFVVVLGGEHTVSIGALAAYAEKYPGLSVLQFDAHADLRGSYEGNKFSHASTMARVCEFIDPRRVVQVGVRALSVEEVDFIKERGVNLFYAHEIRGGAYTHFLKSWDDVVIEKLTDAVYITFDLDFFDPSIMPATGTPEPNGFFWDETMKLLRKLSFKKRIVGVDVVELAPIPGFHAPNITAAKLVYKLINYAFVR